MAGKRGHGAGVGPGSSRVPAIVGQGSTTLCTIRMVRIVASRGCRQPVLGGDRICPSQHAPAKISDEIGPGFRSVRIQDCEAQQGRGKPDHHQTSGVAAQDQQQGEQGPDEQADGSICTIGAHTLALLKVAVVLPSRAQPIQQSSRPCRPWVLHRYQRSCEPHGRPPDPGRVPRQMRPPALTAVPVDLGETGMLPRSSNLPRPRSRDD